MRDRPTCGAGWVEGGRDASEDYVFFAADDLEAHPRFIAWMCEAADQGVLPAPQILWPDGSLQSCGGRGNDVCTMGCAPGTEVDWSPIPFVTRESWLEIVEPHAEMLATLHYSSDVFVSKLYQREHYPSVYWPDAVVTHHNEQLGRDHGPAGESHTRCLDYLAKLG